MLEGSSCKSFKENESGDVAITSIDCTESGRPQLRSEQVRCKKKRQPTNEEVSSNSLPPKMMKTISILTSDDSQAVVPNHEDNGLCAPRSNEEDEKLQTVGGIEQLDRSPSSACSFGSEVDKTGNHPTVLLGLDQHTASTLGMEQESTGKLGMEQETAGELGNEQEIIGKFEMEQETKGKCGMEQVAARTLEMELKTAEMPEMVAEVGQYCCSVTEQHKETITSNESSVKTPSRSRSTPKKAIETAVKATTFLFSSPTSRSSTAVSSAPLLGSSVKRQLLHAMEKEDALPEQMLMDEGGSQPTEITQADIDPNLELFGEEFENFDELFASMDSRDTFGCSNTDQEEEQNLEPYNLFIVTSVTDDAEKRAKILLLSEKKAITPGSRQCVLKGDWYFFNVAPGDEIRLVDPVHGADGVLTVDNEHESYVILNPDWLIGATTVANAVTCPRKAVLSEVFKGGLQKQGGGQEVMVMGSLLHSVFEQVLKTAHSREGSVTVKYVQAVMKKTVLSHSSLESLYAIGVSEVEALKRISEYSSSVVDWVSKYLHPHPQPGKGDIDFKRPVSNLLSEGESSCLCVSNVVDIEENIWAPRYGLKGKIDATVEVKIHRVPRSSVQHTTTPSVEVECSRIPFELKTGKMWTKLGSAEHRAQIILYTLMMEERYGVEVTGGLLHYLKAQHMQGVPAFPSEKRALLMLRNQVAHNLSNGNSTTLPPEMLGLERICKRCSHLSQCCMYHNVIEGGCARSSKIEETFISAVGHLGEDDLEFFGKWFRLIDKEVQFSWRRRPISDIWTQDVGERVLAGVCVLGLRPTSHTSLPEGRVLQVLHTTEGETSSVIPVETMTVGERVVVSGVDGCSWAIGTGNIREVSEKSITVLMDRILPATKLYRIDILNSTSCNNMWVTVANLMLPGERYAGIIVCEALLVLWLC
jgi:CRISPR/Cas system-associated exonuclease Cas4 (RecB family)